MDKDEGLEVRDSKDFPRAGLLCTLGKCDCSHRSRASWNSLSLE